MRPRGLALCAALAACGGGESAPPGPVDAAVVVADAVDPTMDGTPADASTPTADATADAAGAPDAGDEDPCREAPFETYETFGRGFLATWCAGCHAATTRERFGAPPEVTFDTRAEAVALKDRILARAAVEPATMPPAGGSSLLDRERLRIWLTCFEP
jgi:uncharacterized membrane protein